MCLWLLRKAFRLAWWLLLAVAAVAAWPLTVVVAAGYAAAWLRGWPPARLYRAAACSLLVTAAWLAGLEILMPGFLAARAPGRAWAGGWGQLTAAHLAGVFASLAPAAVPAGLALAGLTWAWRNYAITAGLGGIMASAPITFDARQWRRQVATAQGLTAAPGAVPLLGRGGRIPVGGTIRAIGHRWRPVFTLDPAACARHMVIVGSTGSGKTNLMIRLWAGWFTAALAAWRAGRGGRPLLMVLDCKGGRDARRKADRTRRLLYAAGARRVAIWPDEARLSMWDLPPQDLAVLLYQMIESGTGAAAYYADMLYACVVLAVTAPPGPPASTASFLDRLDAKWLASAWGDGRHPRQAGQARAAARHLRDIQLRYATLLDRLGPALDGPGRLEEADAWYFILEGTREPSVAEAQAMAVTE
ncbi:MAG: helicase HerA domain-containing protein, partial [Streptosporangiaceae bacterium]